MPNRIWEQLHSQEFYNLQYKAHVINQRYHMKYDKMRGQYNTPEKGKKTAYKLLLGKPEQKKLLLLEKPKRSVIIILKSKK